MASEKENPFIELGNDLYQICKHFVNYFDMLSMVKSFVFAFHYLGHGFNVCSKIDYHKHINKVILLFQGKFLTLYKLEGIQQTIHQTDCETAVTQEIKEG